MRSFFLAAAAAAALSLLIAPPAAATRRGDFPPTKFDIHLEMVFNSVLFNDGHLGDETGNVDLVWGSYSPDQPPGMYNSFYIPIPVDDAFGATHDVSWYQANHPDWLEYKCDQTTLAYTFGDTSRAPLDFANPQVRAYQWSNWIDPALAAGYQSIAVDEADLLNDFARCGHFDGHHRWVQQYTGDPTDSAFVRDMVKWTKLTRQHIHAQSTTATMQLNAPYNFQASLDDNRALMGSTDLLFDERGFTNYGNSPPVPTPDQWGTIIAEIGEAQSKAICYTLNGEEPGNSADITPQERQWAIANYLLIRDNCTYMYMTGQQQYGDLVIFPEYKISIGKPLGDRFLTQNIWERNYAKGLALVNPYNASATVSLPAGRWFDVDGNRMGPSVTLGQQTGLVLLDHR
ncbi:MAG TPA: putative glycoside hydrolase [Rhizomicrobium sp.]|nr:putative glycoside hydrolase [Rhizomicrobium sp.]